jgi:hypothetical protein
MLLAVRSSLEWVSHPTPVAGALLWEARVGRVRLLTWENCLLEGAWRIEEDNGRTIVVRAEGNGEPSSEAAKLRAEAVLAALTADLYRDKGFG